MRPVIAIVVSLDRKGESYVGGRAYVDAIQAAGGVGTCLQQPGTRHAMIEAFFWQMVMRGLVRVNYPAASGRCIKNLRKKLAPRGGVRTPAGGSSYGG